MPLKLSELRYGGVIIALSFDPNILMQEKLEMVVNTSVRYPELLKIYFEGVHEWLFDETITTKKEASRLLLAGFPYY